MSINLVGADKVLTLSGDGAGANATTAAFTITHAAASALSVAIEPSASTVAGVAIATQPIVEVHDAFGNVVTTGGDSTQTITAALTTGTGALSSTTTEAAVAGVADFVGNGMSINLVGADKVLTFSGDGAGANATTAAFAITSAAASAADSTIAASPTSITANGAATSTVTVQAKDALGNNRTSGGDTVVLATSLGTLGSVTDVGDGTYTATLTVGLVAGTANITGTLGGTAIGTPTTVTFTAVGVPSRPRPRPRLRLRPTASPSR